ncbi:LAQU0S01e14774g1_1 [Lachancea quebecensis]|uniref:LAQU0S01e14774g1_1 n=1 Tax=Lachancea quebecensis TaxID=1654605 RepID=A0A0P1KXM0_9SACH|nr:LAQU0S01e14774g1_1 [Lachancea quebecensis]
MKRPRRRALENSEKEESDSESDQDFSHYIKRKSAAVQKVQREQKFDLDGISFQAPADLAPKPSPASMIENFKASKKQREMDRLFSQSLKARLERENDPHDTKERDVFITKGYEGVKKDLDKAFELAHEEENSELQDKGGIHASLLQAAHPIDPEESSIRGAYTSNQTCKGKPRHSDEKSRVYKNDVYITKPLKIKPQNHNYRQLQQYASPSLDKQSLVQQFLLPEKSKRMIEIEIERYQGRMHRKAA